MKVSILIAGLLLVALAVPFALVRMDVLDAEILRFLPALLAVIVAGAFIITALRHKASEGNSKSRSKK